jgi:hypothetical protein
LIDATPLEPARMTKFPNSTELAASLGIDFPCLVIVHPLPRLRVPDAVAAMTAEQRMHALASGEITRGIDISEMTRGIDISAMRKKKPDKPGRPSIKQMIEGAEKAGKPLASITMPDGTKLDFCKPAPVEPDNPWPLDEFRTKETKQ